MVDYCSSFNPIFYSSNQCLQNTRLAQVINHNGLQYVSMEMKRFRKTVQLKMGNWLKNNVHITNNADQPDQVVTLILSTCMSSNSSVACRGIGLH